MENVSREIRLTRYRLRYNGLTALDMQRQTTRLSLAVGQLELLLIDDDDCDEVTALLQEKYFRLKRVRLRL